MKNGSFLTETITFNGMNQIVSKNSGNAIPLSVWEQGSIASTGNVTSSTKIRTTNYVSVIANKTYELFTQKNQYQLIYALYDGSYNQIQLSTTWKDTVSFTTPANAAYIKVVIRKLKDSETEEIIIPSVYTDANPFLLPLNATSSASFLYDKTGNLLNDGQKSYKFDIVNQMESTTDSSGNLITFGYDEEGKRSSKTTSSGTVKYHYLGDKVIYETDLNNNILVEYTWNPQGYPATMIKNGYTYHYILNGHGDVIGLTDSLGNMVAEYQYDSWGNIISQSGVLADANPLRYAGYYFDKETGLYYLLARYYNPKLGVFLTLDPDPGDADDPLTMNGYTYGLNNPIKNDDPDGHNSRQRAVDKYIPTSGMIAPRSGGTGSNGNGTGGRLGNSTTRAQNQDIADELKNRGWTVTHGGGRGRSEEYLPGPNGSRKGSNYPDITATKNGKTLRINTVDTKSNGQLTTREAKAAQSIRNKTSGKGNKLLTIPKTK